MIGRIDIPGVGKPDSYKLTVKLSNPCLWRDQDDGNMRTHKTDSKGKIIGGDPTERATTETPTQSAE
jgi:hypothetical protein